MFDTAVKGQIQNATITLVTVAAVERDFCQLVNSHTHLLWSQTLHVGGLEDMLEVIVQISDVSVYCHLKKKKIQTIVSACVFCFGCFNPSVYWTSICSTMCPTLFSHSNSAHICLNSASVQEAGWM